ncbi:hypothetical protein [Enterobacter asburiae]|uniref:hypothetical protein n=1 Tax=Enterobacter asburiae TaxID=61645 RepID=UPI000FDB7A6B|nr:hypothetical protein [Enterobacter asburiae]
MEDEDIYHDEIIAHDEIRMKFRDMGLDWLSVRQAKRKLKQLLSDTSASLLPRLQEAFDHYTTLLGITDLYQVDKETLIEERVKHSHLIKYSSDNEVIFEDDQCVRFMSELHDLDLQLCAAFVCSHQP